MALDLWALLSPPPVGAFTWENLIAAVAAIGALGSAAMGLVDATKVGRQGGVSNSGWQTYLAGLTPFAVAFEASIGPDWAAYFRAAWLNGASKAEQLTNARNYIRLGLTPDTGPALAAIGLVNADALTAVARKIATGKALTALEFELVGRMDAAVEARISAAYARAEQIYRNSARVLAGVIAVVLSLLAWWLVLGGEARYFGLSLLSGFAAVPIAPVVKDLISALSASAQAAKALKPLA